MMRMTYLRFEVRKSLKNVYLPLRFVADRKRQNNSFQKKKILLIKLMSKRLVLPVVSPAFFKNFETVLQNNTRTVPFKID